VRGFRWRFVLVLSVALFACGCASTPEHAKPSVEVPAPYVELKTLGALPAAIADLPRDSTLVVLDIDDTLLAMPFENGTTKRVFFGSDSWYYWQSGLAPGDPHLQACRFAFLGINYESEALVASEHDAPTIVASLPFDRLIETSRSPDYRGATERELRLAGFAFPDPVTRKPSVIVVDDKALPTYEHGIYMTRGGDKGEKLFDELARDFKHSYTDIVLVDDGWKNQVNMRAAAGKARVRFHGFLYTGVKTDPNKGATDVSKLVFPLAPEDANAADRAWDHWMSWFKQTYPQRAERLVPDSAECAN
jgi:hypothetical protein